MNLEQAIQLRENGHAAEALELLRDLLKEDPHNPTTLYHYAWSCDAQGLETEAAPYYEQALANGLVGREREGAFIGLGSTYRVIGQYTKSRAVFEKGMVEFPDNQALRVFYAMTLHNLKEHDRTMETLLLVIATTAQNKDIENYTRAIHYYKDKLNQTW